MKKRTTKTTDPLDTEIDFARFGPARRNAFRGAGENDGPSLLALWEMPELPEEGVLVRRGHPGKGKDGKTVVRSVRLPEAIWKELEEKAHAKHLNLHQAMRVALLRWLRRAD